MLIFLRYYDQCTLVIFLCLVLRFFVSCKSTCRKDFKSTYYKQEGFLMTWSLLFFTTNIFLGIGLAMDAFSVSMANGLNEPHMNKGRVCTIAGVFGGFFFFLLAEKC